MVLKFLFSFYLWLSRRGERQLSESVFLSRRQLLRGNSQIPRVSWQNNRHHKLFVFFFFCLTHLQNALCSPRQENDAESSACEVAKNGAQWKFL